MKPSKLKKIRYFLEYLLFVLFSFWVPFLSRQALYRLSTALGTTAYYLLSRRRFIALTNLNIAFPDLEKEEKISIIKKSFANVFLGIFYILWLKGIESRTIESLVEVDHNSLEYMRRAFEKQKGVLVLVGHFGNWELMGISYGLNNLPPLNSIARKLDNPYLEKKLLQFRTSTGNHVIYKTNATKEAIRALKRNECVGFLIDHNVAVNEIFVDFFGKKAATNRSLASLALSTGAPIIAATSFPLDGGRFRTVYSQEIRLEHLTNKKDDIVRLTQKCTDHIQEIIRSCPEGWMWGHRRWKKRPAGEPPIYS